MEYRLLALDMDGTVLTSKKVISPRTEAAIHEALAKGKEVLFATGRCPAEMRGYFETFPDMKYVMCISGALILNIQTGETLTDIAMPRPMVELLLKTAKALNVMTSVSAGPHVFVERRHRGNMEHFNCQCFAALYDDCATWVDDAEEILDTFGDRVYKINYYCPNDEVWQKAAGILKNLPLSCASGIPLDLEITAEGVNKGMGLETLSRVTGISLSEMIAVGDEGNDLEMIQTAGLGVAMGNAADEVIAAADAMTADCDHDGVAEVIKHCLL